MMTKAEREAWGRCNDNNARLRRENAEAIASRDEALAECNALKIIASSMRWHAVYGATVAVQAAERAIRDGTDRVDPDTVPRLVSQAAELADASERDWAELHDAKEQGR
jgi:hypothetical protein